MVEGALPTELLSQFEPLGALGRGGMGVVMRARERASGREVALKLALETATPARLARFAREGSLTASLDHPGIVRVHQAGVADGKPFLVYELVADARTLEEAFAGASRERRVALVLDVARAIGHAHAHGVVHRDLKPDNVLVDADGRVRVTDFGLATAIDLERLTQTGGTVGTPLFMAPEQFGGSADESRSPRIDVWALGVLLHLALTGQLPFDGDNVYVLSAAIAGAQFTRPRALDRTVPAPLEAVVVWALSPEPTRRPADGAAFAAALEGALRGEMPRTGRRRAGALAALAVASVALGTTALGLRSPGAGDPSPISGPATWSTPASPTLAPITTPVVAPAAVWGRPGPDGRLVLPPPEPGEDVSLLILRDNAADGNMASLVSLGRRLVEGKGCRRNVEGGVGLLRVAADQGDVDVMFWLGERYADGEFVAGDAEEARRWYERAAAAGDRRGLASLARLALAREDLTVAFLHCGRAAAFGDLKHAFDLGEDLRLGTGAPLNQDLALWVFSVAAARGSPPAAQRAGELLRTGARRDLPRARAYFVAAAERGDPGGAEGVGLMLLAGDGGGRDPVAALRWLRVAAESNKSLSQRALGLLLADGDVGVAPAPAEAVRWLELRVQDRVAARRLGRLLWYGAEGVPRDCPRGLRLVTESSLDHDVTSYFETARWLLEGGPGVPSDPARALPRFTHAANRGHTGAMVELARLALRGGKEKNRDFARSWLARAAKAGDREAVAELARQGWASPDGVAPVESR